jgi:hypothetical protein
MLVTLLDSGLCVLDGGLCLVHLSLGQREFRLRFVHPDLEILRVDLDEQVSFLDLLIVVHGQLYDRPADARGDANHVRLHVGVVRAGIQFVIPRVKENRHRHSHQRHNQDESPRGLAGAHLRRAEPDIFALFDGPVRVWRGRRRRSLVRRR